MITKYIENSWNFGEKKFQKSASWYVEYKSDSDYTYVVALFLGSGEYYSSNRNGDFFPEKELLAHYKTFLKAHHFKHHVNDDPEKSYGKVEAVFYNPEMHRVEGIIKIDNKKSPEMVERINGGEHVPLSMACRVPHDICSICGHKSKKLSEYCTHLKRQMCEVLDDGRKVFAINVEPDFFDISEVTRGADPTACVFRKVASRETSEITSEVSEKEDDYEEKLAILKRLAAIEKKIVGLIQKKDPKIKILPEIYKESSLISPMDIGIFGRCLIYQDLIDSPYKKNLLKNANFTGIPKNFSCKNFKISDILIHNDDLLKIAALNIDYLSKNTHLLKDEYFLGANILRNILVN